MCIRDSAKSLLSKLELDLGKDIRNRSQDSNSLGVARQSILREESDKNYYVEPNLWTGIGRARSGCGAALVGSTDQVISKIEGYKKMGIKSFILSGYPHLQESEYFGTKVLPSLETCSLPLEYGRVPAVTPDTPLGNGERK